VHEFMRNQIPDDEIGSHDDPPVKRNILQGGTVSPFCPLTHYIDLMGILSKFYRKSVQIIMNFFPGLHAQPILEAFCR